MAGIYSHAARAVVFKDEDGDWMLSLEDSQEDEIATWRVPTQGPFFDDVINYVGPHLNRVGLAYRGSAAWDETGGIWSAWVYDYEPGKFA
jgi:hypothetical protein